jgi:phosphatidylinositol alpha-1,6-mannosyltransferase
MRILMLDNEFPPLGGGMGTANFELLKCFSRNPALEIDLVTSSLDSQYQEEKFSDHISIYKVPVWNKNIHHSSNRELLFYTFQTLFVSRKLIHRNSYDFCFAWSAVPAGGVALVLNKLYRLPYMVWVSGPDIPGFEQRYRYLYKLLTPLLSIIWQNATPLIAKCREELDMICRIKPNQKIEIIPNGINLSKFQPRPIVDNNGPLKIICVARLIERKGQRYLIQATKKLTDNKVDVELDLIGTGDSFNAYHQLVVQKGISNKVHFYGYVPREDIPTYLKKAHVFALPSYCEGMSLATLEAMACGLPVIVTRTGGTDVMVIEGVNGYTFEWADVETLVLQISKLAINRENTRRMGIMARKISEEFSWDFISQRYLDLFSKTQRFFF